MLGRKRSWAGWGWGWGEQSRRLGCHSGKEVLEPGGWGGGCCWFLKYLPPPEHQRLTTDCETSQSQRDPWQLSLKGRSCQLAANICIKGAFISGILTSAVEFISPCSLIKGLPFCCFKKKKNHFIEILKCQSFQTSSSYQKLKEL